MKRTIDDFPDELVAPALAFLKDLNTRADGCDVFPRADLNDNLAVEWLAQHGYIGGEPQPDDRFYVWTRH